MASAGQALDKARSYLGLVEGPKDNETLFGAWSGANFQPWCHSFTSYILDSVGAGIGKLTYCPAGVNYFKNKGALFTVPQAGDLFYLYFADMGRYAHVGFVEKVDGEYVVTVEGNSNSGGSRTGGMVCRNRRHWKGTKMVFGRPAYSAPAQPAPAPPSNITEPQWNPPIVMPTITKSQKGPDGGVRLKGVGGQDYDFGAGAEHGDWTAHSPGLVMPLIVASLKAPGGGVWLLGRGGEIYAFFCADKDAPNRHPDYWAGRVAARLETLGDGYRVIDSTGAHYDYP